GKSARGWMLIHATADCCAEDSARSVRRRVGIRWIPSVEPNLWLEFRHRLRSSWRAVVDVVHAALRAAHHAVALARSSAAAALEFDLERRHVARDARLSRATGAAYFSSGLRPDRLHGALAPHSLRAAWMPALATGVARAARAVRSVQIRPARTGQRFV